MSETIILNEWDLKMIEKKGLVESGKYVVMTLDEYRNLLKSHNKGK